MPSFNGQPVYRYSAATRKGTNPAAGAASGSQSSYSVSNSGGQASGEGMGMVRSKYRESRQAGMSPDASRGAALNEYSYNSGTGPGGRQGPSINMATDYNGKRV